MTEPIELLNVTAIRGALAASALGDVADLHVRPRVGSTNQQLLDEEPPPPGKMVACLAEHQIAGRGRRGRAWYSSPGGSLCLSVGWCFEHAPDDLSALTLATGVILRRTLNEMAGVNVELKWPNDLVLDNRKLGGILVELRPDSGQRCFVVIGVGLNVTIDSRELSRISDWPAGAIDLSSMMGGRPPSRNILAARFIEALWQLLRRYPDRGFSSYRSEYAEADFLRGRSISIEGANRSMSGLAAGVDNAGMLLVDRGGEIERVTAGEVSVRSVP